MLKTFKVKATFLNGFARKIIKDKVSAQNEGDAKAIVAEKLLGEIVEFEIAECDRK